MDESRVTHISIQLCQKLLNPSAVHGHSQFSIFRVPNQLRKVYEKAYEPQIVSIGPYHRGKAHLQGMEKYKMHLLRQLLKRIIRRRGGEGGENEIQEEVRKFVVAIGALEESARQCYDQPICLHSEEFVQMMIVDGCFIIELIRSFVDVDNRRQEDDPSFVLKLDLYITSRDFLLLENQLPLFVMLELFNLMKIPSQQNCDLICMITTYLKYQNLLIGFPVIQGISSPECKHLLDLIHHYWLPSSILRGRILGQRDELKVIRCATELIEAGIKFKKVDAHPEGRGPSMFDIRFKNGRLEIPTLIIEDETESFLRNIIAYEQLPLANDICYATDYMILMDCLIDSRRDVQLLCRCGIIDNRLGDDEVIATLFNRLGDYVIPSSCHFFYSELFSQVNKHCSKKKNKWMAKLRHDYFNSPWAVVSFWAAVALLFFTFLQTIYTVLAFYK
ncbi:hypothetical protein P3X46_023901 [Hevea brasiliensis]|uniref:Uncharacterized protein n=2 Tax=Hevea brasiliensis TaxID=3981 RepID=A0ABQ9LFV8_HEVBR|nr:hypothetical protein P3X46_023901 [Hevea brasiliensis]